MNQAETRTVDEYLSELPDDRRAAISAVRKVILDNLPDGYEEMMLHGMIGYGVPLALYPKGYLGDKTRPLPLAALASQKNYMSLYMMAVYGDPKTHDWFVKAFESSGKKLVMGKSCVRFRKLDELPLDVIGKAISRVNVEEWVKIYEKTRQE